LVFFSPFFLNKPHCYSIKKGSTLNKDVDLLCVSLLSEPS
jgi:hypothetical protein